MARPAIEKTTLEDFLSIPEDERYHEFLGGEIVPKTEPSGEHGDGQSGIVAAVRPPFQRPLGGGGPGGWWILTEVESSLDTGDIVGPDVSGWRRERCPQRPSGFPIRVRPDWICEVISTLNASNDRVRKLRIYHQARIPHYWLVDPRDETLTVMRWSEDGFTSVLAAQRGEIVRAEPFDAIELQVGTLFGDDPH